MDKYAGSWCEVCGQIDHTYIEPHANSHVFPEGSRNKNKVEVDCDTCISLLLTDQIWDFYRSDSYHAWSEPANHVDIKNTFVHMEVL